MKQNPLIILATYWNERYFIEPSLRQIEALNPCEVIICDGCFNPSLPNGSTDGTREIIQEFVKKHPNARLVSAQRPSILYAAWLLLRGHKHLSWWAMFRPVRWKFLLVSLLRVAYQRNEGITFNHMIGLSKTWKPGMWFMTYDADQFYSDEMVEKIKSVVNDNPENVDLMIGTEMTFFKNFTHYTTSYEKRRFSNMPHRIYVDTLLQPQRSMIRETKTGIGSSGFRDILAKYLYVRFAKAADVGLYFHYKLNPSERLEAGYAIGSRKKPDPSQYDIKEFTGKHPQIIQEYFGV